VDGVVTLRLGGAVALRAGGVVSSLRAGGTVRRGGREERETERFRFIGGMVVATAVLEFEAMVVIGGDG
jgi:hypothetical protein